MQGRHDNHTLLEDVGVADRKESSAATPSLLVQQALARRSMDSDSAAKADDQTPMPEKLGTTSAENASVSGSDGIEEGTDVDSEDGWESA